MDQTSATPTPAIVGTEDSGINAGIDSLSLGGNQDNAIPDNTESAAPNANSIPDVSQNFNVDVGESAGPGAVRAPSAAGSTDSASSTTRSQRGAAYIFLNSGDKSAESKGKEILTTCKNWFMDCGLKVPKQFSSHLTSDYKRMMGTDKVSVFLIWESDYSIKPEVILGNIVQTFPESHPKLVILCRELSGNSAEFASVKRLIDSGEEFGLKYPNVFFMYMEADDANQLCFLTELKKKYEDKENEDQSYPGRSPCISSIVPSKLSDGTKRQHFLYKNSLVEPLRIEARSFSDSLLRNCSGIVGGKRWEHFDPFPSGRLRIEKEVDSYENKCDGRILIINNENYENSDDYRRGSKIDVQNLEDLFSKLKYKEDHIETNGNLTVEQMKKAVSDFATRGDHGSFAILVILSHGSYDEIIGANNSKISIIELIRPFVQSKSLAGKPKLLIINACRDYGILKPVSNGGEYASTSPSNLDRDTQLCAWHYFTGDDVRLTDNSPRCAGLIIAYATTPGNLSYGLGYSGSRFIHALCWTFYKHAANMDVVSMINKVNYRLSQCDRVVDGVAQQIPKQISSWTVQTNRKFFLVETKVEKSPLIPVSVEDDSDPDDHEDRVGNLEIDTGQM